MTMQMLTTMETESQMAMTPTHVTMTTMDGMIPGKMHVVLIQLMTHPHQSTQTVTVSETQVLLTPAQMLQLEAICVTL